MRPKVKLEASRAGLIILLPNETCKSSGSGGSVTAASLPQARLPSLGPPGRNPGALWPGSHPECPPPKCDNQDQSPVGNQKVGFLSKNSQFQDCDSSEQRPVQRGVCVCVTTQVRSTRLTGIRAPRSLYQQGRGPHLSWRCLVASALCSSSMTRLGGSGRWTVVRCGDPVGVDSCPRRGGSALFPPGPWKSAVWPGV